MPPRRSVTLGVPDSVHAAAAVLVNVISANWWPLAPDPLRTSTRRPFVVQAGPERDELAAVGGRVGVSVLVRAGVGDAGVAEVSGVDGVAAVADWAVADWAVADWAGLAAVLVGAPALFGLDEVHATVSTSGASRTPTRTDVRVIN
jgi:hypothetical protein